MTITSANAPSLRLPTRSRRLAAATIAVAALLAASPALDAARAADRPHPERAVDGAHHGPPLTTLELARTAREPQPTGTAAM